MRAVSLICCPATIPLHFTHLTILLKPFLSFTLKKCKLTFTIFSNKQKKKGKYNLYFPFIISDFAVIFKKLLQLIKQFVTCPFECFTCPTYFDFQNSFSRFFTDGDANRQPNQVSVCEFHACPFFAVIKQHFVAI